MTMNDDNAQSSARLRYEQMLDKGTSAYFEVAEIEDIVISYEKEMAHRKALQALAYGLELYPGNDTLLLRKAQCLLSVDRVEEAWSTLQAVHEEGIETDLLKGEVQILRGHNDEALAALHDAIDSPQCTIDDCIDILDMSFEYDCIPLLLQLIPHMEQRMPDMTAFYREMAFSYEDADRPTEAIEWYNKVLDANPYSADDWEDLAKAYVNARQYDRAIEACDFALAIDEKDENLIAYKAYCHLLNEQYDEALQLYNEFRNLTSDKLQADVYIADVLGRMGRNEEAIELLQRTIAIDGGNAHLHHLLALNYYDMGHNDLAMQSLRRSVQFDEADAFPHVLLGQMLLLQNNYEEAYEHLVYITHMPYEDLDSIALFADCCFHLQRYDEAIPLLEKVIAASPYEAHFYFELIMSYIALGNNDSALMWMDRTAAIAADARQLQQMDKSQREVWMELNSQMHTLREALKDILDNNI